MSHASADVLTAPEAAKAATPITLVRDAEWDAVHRTLDPMQRSLAELAGFKAKPGQCVVLPGEAPRVLYGAGDGAMALRGLPSKLKEGDYRLEQAPTAEQALAWAVGLYRFDRYKKEHGKPQPRLVVPDAGVRDEATRMAHALALARDMVNTPANDMGPLQIETIAREIAEAHGADCSVIAGDDLLAQNYPAVHAVGRAAVLHRAPRMIELSWRGSQAAVDAPLIAIVGKGVVFDTGGLDIKPSSGMRLMKKDMGGAAHALALARMVMGADLPIRLSVLVPVVENAISGDAMRPGDVLESRAGLTIEVGNTDAEGRLILADALTRAGELAPVLTLDFATLTGAARVALGPEVIPFYTADDELAAELAAAATAVDDPLWRMPLWAGYEEALDSDIADLKNDPDGWAQAGSVTAALFLKRFAPKAGAWVHFDVFAWCSKSRAGRPVGGEAQAIRAVFEVLRDRFE
jgi:leucyl aminopeptidase